MNDNTQADPENTVLIISGGLWVIALLAAAGYFLHGPFAAAVGSALGVMLVVHEVQTRTVTGTIAHSMQSTKQPRAESIDWKRLLDYEKFYFARQMECDGYEEQAEEIYLHLVDHDFPGSAPFKRLAAIYRRRGQPETELEVLEKALARLDDSTDGTSPISFSSTRRELERQCQEAEERLAVKHTASPEAGTGS